MEWLKKRKTQQNAWEATVRQTIKDRESYSVKKVKGRKVSKEESGYQHGMLQKSKRGWWLDDWKVSSVS